MDSNGREFVGRNGIYFPTPADTSIGFDPTRPFAALCVGQTVEGDKITVDIIIFTNIREQLGGVSARPGVGVGMGQGQFAPHGIGLTEAS